MKRDRPTAAGSCVTTPRSGKVLSFLGSGMCVDGLALSQDELESLRKLYGYTLEAEVPRPPPPVYVEPASTAWPSERRKAEEDHKRAMGDWKNWTSPRAFMQAGADRNCVRAAKADGLRLMAWLARFIPAGEDPLKTLIQLASDSGFDIEPEDLAWAQEEPEEAGEVGT
jgi:hypothetical protein